MGKLLKNKKHLKKLGNILVNLKNGNNDMNTQEFEELYDLAYSNQWPNAVHPDLICDTYSEFDKTIRAESILDIIVKSKLENQNFLDFGCGEGHVFEKSKLRNPKKSIGYDITKHKQWEEFSQDENSFLTTNWEQVKENGPYDIILLYDVLDHVEDPQEELIKITKVIKPETKIYIRFHPFCSRHGTHVYKKLNKAYVHLVFTNEELKAMDIEQEKVKKVFFPLRTYKSWLEPLFNIQYLEAIREPIERFFIDNKIVSKRIKESFKDCGEIILSNGSVFPSVQIEQQFIDAVCLTKLS